jgi:hypothetical protein
MMPIIQRRRPGFRGSSAIPFTPKSLGAGLKLWLRADLGVTKTGADVTAWQDQSATGALWSLVTASPQYSASEINGQAGIVFAAANQYLGWTSGTISVAAPWTWLAVFKESITPGAYGLAGYGIFSTGPTVGMTVQSATANSHYLYTYTGPIGEALVAPTATMEAGVVGRLSSGAVTPKQALNTTTGAAPGADVALDLSGVTGKLGLISPGGGSLTICELLVAAEASDLAKLRPYIKARYGLTLS